MVAWYINVLSDNDDEYNTRVVTSDCMVQAYFRLPISKPLRNWSTSESRPLLSKRRMWLRQTSVNY